MPEKGKRGLENLAKKLDLPGGMLGRFANIELHGNKEAIIDGNCTILEYSDTVIRVSSGANLVRFCGRDLNLSALSCNGAVISGVICTVDFID